MLFLVFNVVIVMTLDTCNIILVKLGTNVQIEGGQVLVILKQGSDSQKKSLLLEQKHKLVH